MADNTVTGAVTSSIRPQARPKAVSGIGAKAPARQEEKAELSFMDRITNLFTGFGGKDPKEKPASVNTHNVKLSVYQDMEDEARRSAELHRQDREGMGITQSLTPEQWAQRYSKEKGVMPNTTPPFWHQKQEHSEALAVIPVAETPIPTQSRGAGLMSPPSAGQLPAVDTTGTDNFDTIIMRQLVVHEGQKNYPYKDTEGKWTIGVGHFIGDDAALAKSGYSQYSEANPMSDAEVAALFNKDLEKHRKIAESYPFYADMSDEGKRAILDLTFNMGDFFNKKKDGKYVWANLRRQLLAGEWDAAADNLASSKYARQVGQRAITVTNLLRQAGG